MYLLRVINTNLHKFMALPAILLFALFFLYPLSQGIGISLTNWNGVSQAKFSGCKISLISFMMTEPSTICTIPFFLRSEVHRYLIFSGTLYSLILGFGILRGRA